jgi:putative sigma-54 modulation protein
MNIQITSRHSKASSSLQDSLKEELERLERFYDKITHCHVILDQEHTDKIVEINMNILNNTVTAKAKADSVGKAIAESIEKIERQLKKFNSKIKSHKSVKELNA